MKTLNFIPLPIPEESPTSLIKRLAMHNGYGNCSKFFEHHMRFKAPKATVLIQGNRYETLLMSQVGQSLHGRVQQSFYPLANPRSPGGAFKIGPLRIGRFLLRPRKAALCTECVIEGWERYIKDMCLSTHCPVHNRHYLFACPHCQRKLTWKNQSSLQCSCGGVLESPPCSPKEALAENRLFDILKSGDQTRLDNLLSLISLLGVPQNRISSTSTICTRLAFSAAAALVFDDYHTAATTLSFMIDVSDDFEVEIIAAKLSPIITKGSLSLLIQQLKASPPYENPASQQITISAKCMATLLGISKKKWEEFRATLNHSKKPAYSKLEARQIKDTYETTPHLNESTKSAKRRELMALCLTLSETTSQLGLSTTECRMLEIEHLLVPLFRVSSRPYFKKEDIERFRSEYISVKKLATRLNTSNAQLRRAIRNTQLITSLDDQAGCLFLVRTENIATIQECLIRLPAVNSKLPAKRNVQTCDPNHVRMMNLTQAARLLGTHANTVIYYRDLGLIRCANNDTLQFSISDIASFHNNYSTCKQLAKELETTGNRIAQLLEPLKIYPISGGIINGHRLSVYDRSTLPPNLKELINPTHDTFGTYWMRDDLYSLGDAARQLGILRSDFKKFFTTAIRPDRAKHYRRFQTVTPDEIERVHSLLASYSKLSTFLSSRGITHAAFIRRFAQPKFIRVVKINNEEHLSLSDLSKLDALLDKYCTPTEAGETLHISTEQVYRLRKSGLLTSVRLPGYEYKHPLLERAQVINSLKLITSNTNQRYSSHLV